MFLLLLTCVVTVAVTAQIIRRTGIWTLPSFAAIIFTAGFSLRALYLHWTGATTVFGVIQVTPTQSVDMLATGLAAFLAMCLGMRTAIRTLAPREPASALPAIYSPWRLIFVAAVLYAGQYDLLRHVFGGGSSALTALSQRAFTTDSIGPAANITYVAAPVSIYALVVARRAGNTAATFWTGFLLAASLPWLAIVNGRAAVIFTLWAIGVTFKIEAPRRTRPRTVVIAVALMLLTTVAGLAWRTSSQTQQPFTTTLRTTASQTPQVVSDSLPLYDHMRVGMEYVSLAGHDEGANLGDAFTVLVPRALYPGKPIYLPQRLGRAILLNNLSGLPAGLLGEGYIAFGWVGAILYALIFGFIVGTAHAKIRISQIASPVTTWLIFITSSLTLVTLRTGAQGALIETQIALVALLAMPLIGRFSRLPTRRPAVSPKNLARASNG